MIRIVLLGRTGNHLFQYALGRVLAEKHDVPLVLDASWFNAAGWAEVSHFLKLPIKARVLRRFSLPSRALRNLVGKHPWQFLRCPFLVESPTDQSFDPRFLNAPSDCVLFGYFQTPRYFESIAHELREEYAGLLTTVASKSSPPRALLQRLADPTSVAVHVRRGDYIHHAAFAAVCDDSYYHLSMNRMRQFLPTPQFFVFSDDPGWCRAAFKGGDIEVVDCGSRADNPLNDLHLMSLASHHIIANSTYSWWAAWIGKKSGQVVIMPDRWYGDASIVAPIDEKRLPGWTILSTDKSQQ